MVTLTILNFNGNDTLAESIDSVLAQTHKPDRFVVIDNASTDGSRKIAIDKGVEVFDADNRYKFITGLNTAIAMNQDKLFFMQNDVVLAKDCLQIMLYHCPTSNFIAQPVIYETNRKIDNSGMDYYGLGFGLRRHTDWWRGSLYVSCGLVTTICFMTDNKDIYYDELFSPAYYEDIDFYLRTKNKLSHVLIPNAKAIHKGNHTFSQSYKKLEISRICRENRMKLVRKHYSGLDRMVRTAVLSVLDVAKESIDVIRDRWVSSNDRH